MILRMVMNAKDRSGWFVTPDGVVNRHERLQSPQVPQECLAVSAVEANPATAATRRSPASLPLDALDGGELIILAIKPAALSPVFESAGWLAAMAMLAVCVIFAQTGSTPLVPASFAQICLGVAALRLVLAVVRWSATWYVLTNRRVLLISGIRSPRIASLALVDVRNTCLTAAPHEKLTRLSTITFIPRTDQGTAWSWKHLHNGEEVHRRVRRAIENAIDLLPH